MIQVKLLFEFEANIHRYLLQTEVPLVGLKLRSKMGISILERSGELSVTGSLGLEHQGGDVGESLLHLIEVQGVLAGIIALWLQAKPGLTFEQVKDVLKKGIKEDVQFEIIAHYPDGSELKSGIRVRQSDVELFEALQSML